MRNSITGLLAATLLAFPAAAQARNIVLTNDDGLSSNVVALYHALKAAGHDVIVSVPCTNQSGKGASIDVGRPISVLAAPCRNGAAQVGDPGAGMMTREGLGPDFHYVSGTPVMAMLQGAELLARERWGAAPDLVLSGPNEGQNLGSIILSSGTVSAAQYAALAGIPAIALSAGEGTMGTDLAVAESAEVARLSVELVTALEARAGDGPLLPNGLALNVNFPEDLSHAQWRASEIGTYNAYRLSFVRDMAASASPAQRASAEARGIELPRAPGLSFERNSAQPTAEQMDDESIVFRTAIAVSPMQAGYAPGAAESAMVAWLLAGFVEAP